MQQYHSILEEVMDHGKYVKGRNAATRELFGVSTAYRQVWKDFPLLSTKFTPFKSILSELICFVRGYTRLEDFQNMGVDFWTANAESDYWKANPNYKEGSLGRIYGAQWRDWNGEHDQLQTIIKQIKVDPNGRRHIVSAWNPTDLKKMCLPPCHAFFHVNIRDDHFLDLLMYQRSADLFLGVPFNIASYAALMYILGHQTGYVPGDFTHVIGSAHIYEQHFKAVDLLLTRDADRALPTVTLDAPDDCSLDDYEPEHFSLNGYDPLTKIYAPMIV